MAKKSGKRVPVLPKISEEMKEWSALLGGELATWPGVSTKPMFGMTAYYRGEHIFAVLPKTRGFGTPKAVAFRFESIGDVMVEELKADGRVITNPIGAKWISFEVDSARDLNAALEWMSRAFEGSGSGKSARKSKVGSRRSEGKAKRVANGKSQAAKSVKAHGSQTKSGRGDRDSGTRGRKKG
jgi:hypothetical protein